MRNTMTDAELAAYAKANKTKQHGSWSNVEYLLATIIDSLAMNEYAIYRAQGGKPRKPELFPRPGVLPRGAKPETTTPDKNVVVDINALQQLRNRPKE